MPEVDTGRHKRPSSAHEARSGGGRLHVALVALVALSLVGCGIAAQSPGAGATSTAAAQTAGPETGAPETEQPTTAPTGTAGAESPAATGTTAAQSPTATAEATATTAGPPPTPTGELAFANWPLYIDIDEETGGYPTLEKFQEETGITVTYSEDIGDNEEFFGRIQPDLAAGNPTGYDLIVVTDWMVERMARLGYLEPLNHGGLPNFEANAVDLVRDPWYDPGNQYSLAWQSGITGIAYNPTLTGREITSFDDLLDPEFAGRVGLFSEMRDTMSLTLLSMGIEPENATIEDVEAARDKLLGPAEDGQFRGFYGNEYYDALAAGDLAISIAWSGDISQMQLYDNADVQFVIPETGGMLWVDNMVIPKAAPHVGDAHSMMNFWYDTENAVALTEYIGYFSPVDGVPERVLEDAETAREEGDEEWASQLEVIAQTAIPSDEQLQNVYTYKVLTEEEERAWNDAFNEVALD